MVCDHPLGPHSTVDPHQHWHFAVCIPKVTFSILDELFLFIEAYL